jgi:acyl dehydratase
MKLHQLDSNNETTEAALTWHQKIILFRGYLALRNNIHPNQGASNFNVFLRTPSLEPDSFMQLFFEDIPTSLSLTLGPRALTTEDSLRFCKEFDRLPIHLDQNAASASIYGGIIASGLHTLSLTASIVADEFLCHTMMTGASGLTDVRWYLPVHPPESISVRIVVREKIPPRPGRSFGTIRIELETYNAAEEKVMSAIVSYLFHSHESTKI